MERNYSFDLNALPVHMFVKSAKEAKKINSQNGTSQQAPVIFKREHKFRPANDYELS